MSKPGDGRFESYVDAMRSALEQAMDVGIYPKSSPHGERTPWQDGWNAACMAVGDAFDAAWPTLAAKLSSDAATSPVTEAGRALLAAIVEPCDRTDTHTHGLPDPHEWARAVRAVEADALRERDAHP